MKRKRANVAKKPLVPPPLKSMKKAREVTSKFHQITREMNAAAEEGDEERKKNANAALESLGGRQLYQEASVLTTSKHRTCKFVFSQLTQLNQRPSKGQPPLLVLEVGAVNTQLLNCPWMNVRAIDIQSQHTRIEQIDFFDLNPEALYQVVVSSMVLNCVPTGLARGRMLREMHRHLRLGGFCFIMIPRRCLEASPYMTWEKFQQALKLVGFKVLTIKKSPKVGFLCCEAVKEAPQGKQQGFKAFSDPPKVILRGKHLTNDFCVCFDVD